MTWDPPTDQIRFYPVIEDIVWTKRGVLRRLAQLFDPMGLLYVCMYVKLYLKTLAPSTVRWFPRGASTMLKITKDIKGKEDYLQIGVTPDVMVRRCYNLFQIYIVLELSFKWLLNRCIDSASFVSIERLFHSLAPLYLKLFFRNSLLGLGRAKSV